MILKINILYLSNLTDRAEYAYRDNPEWLNIKLPKQYKLLYIISNNIEAYEEPPPRTKKIPYSWSKAGEEKRIVYESL